MNIPVKDIPKKKMDKILYGSDKEKVRVYFLYDLGKTVDSMIHFEGVINNIARRYHDTSSDFIRETLEKFMAVKNCPSCKGYRLNEEALSVLINGMHISQVTDYSINEAKDFFTHIELTEKEEQIARLILKEICDRLDFLNNVGLDYLTLSRSSGKIGRASCRERVERCEV